MNLIRRSYQNEDDYWRIRSFLRDVYLRNGRREISWPAARLDYWRRHGIANMNEGPLETCVFLWETEEGKLVAVLNCESPGQTYLQIDPEHRTAELEAEMIDLAEEKLFTIGKKSGRKAVAVWVNDGDTMREELLAARGFARKAEWQCFNRYRDLALPIPDVQAPEGYTIRPMTLEEIPSRSWASWRAFHPDEPDEDYQGHEWYWSLTKAPMYRRDLDLVAIAENGSVAAFVTVWYDDVTRSGYFEPVGTMPEHQRKGLCTALLYEGMRRLKERGAVQASVGGGGLSNPKADGVYASAFGRDEESYVGWLKYLDGQPAPKD
jgi:mycothiol synthase